MTDWTNARAYIIRMDYVQTRQLTVMAQAQADAKYRAYVVALQSEQDKGI